jgi:hypothetical protein
VNLGVGLENAEMKETQSSRSSQLQISVVRSWQNSVLRLTCLPAREGFPEEVTFSWALRDM